MMSQEMTLRTKRNRRTPNLPESWFAARAAPMETRGRYTSGSPRAALMANGSGFAREEGSEQHRPPWDCTDDFAFLGARLSPSNSAKAGG